MSKANFKPSRENQNDLTPFRFWCQKVLPLVYDDSLSYYELLCKVIDYLNKTMENVTNLNTDMNNLYKAFVKLQNYVNHYFDDLDVQKEINNKLDEMVKDGTFIALLRRYSTPPRDIYLQNYLPTFQIGDNIDNLGNIITSILASIGNEQHTIFIPTGTYDIYETITIPATVSIVTQKGAIFNVRSNGISAFYFIGVKGNVHRNNGILFDGGGCTFNLYKNNTSAITIDGTINDIARTSVSNIFINGDAPLYGTSERNNYTARSVGIKLITKNIYLLTFNNIIFSNTICVQWGETTDLAVNSGENIKFYGCVFTYIPFYVFTNSFSCSLNCCSFDYCDAFSINDANNPGISTYFLTDCHIERCVLLGDENNNTLMYGNSRYYVGNNANFDKTPINVQLRGGSHLKLMPSLVSTAQFFTNSPMIDVLAPVSINGYNMGNNILNNGVFEDVTNDVSISTSVGYSNNLGSYKISAKNGIVNITSCPTIDELTGITKYGLQFENTNPDVRAVFFEQFNLICDSNYIQIGSVFDDIENLLKAYYEITFHLGNGTTKMISYIIPLRNKLFSPSYMILKKLPCMFFDIRIGLEIKGNLTAKYYGTVINKLG